MLNMQNELDNGDDDLGGGSGVVDEQDEEEIDDAQIDKIAESYARRTTERGGRKKQLYNQPQKFNVRPRNPSDCEDELQESIERHQEEEEEQPKRKGRPPGSGRKEKDFEEMLQLQKEKNKESARKHSEKKQKGKKVKQ